MSDDDEAPFELREGEVIAKRWMIDQRLGQGACGIIYKVHDVNNRRKRAALKIELIDDHGPNVLKQEVRVLQLLQKRSHVIELVKFGKRSQFNYMIITLCGKNLTELRRYGDLGLLSAATCSRIGIHALYAMKQLHEIGYIHRDVKPQNLVMGRGRNSRTVFLIDYGLAREYVIRQDQVVRHRKPRKKTLMRGTIRYCSQHVHSREEQSRRDDVWSLVYVIVELHAGLPWHGKQEKDAHKMKLEVRDEVLMADCPPEWTMILKHVKKLEFEERPDYRRIYDLLHSVMLRLKVSFTDPYEWESKSKQNSIMKSTSSSSNVARRSSSGRSKNGKPSGEKTKTPSAEKEKPKLASAEQSEAPDDVETPPTADPEEFSRNDIGF